jgi:hypothetical protein
MRLRLLLAAGALAGLAAPAAPGAEDPPRAYVTTAPDRITLTWPVAEGPEAPAGRLVLDLRRDRPLVAELGVLDAAGTPRTRIEAVEPVAFVTVGTRVGTPGRPPDMSPFNEFFDSPARRPHETFRTVREAQGWSRVEESQGRRRSVELGPIAAGPFRGHWRFTVYAGCALMKLEAVLTTDRPDAAFLYDLGLVAAEAAPRALHWIDTEGERQRAEPPAAAPDRALKVRHRLVVAEGAAGAIALFPPPHQYFFPRDYTDNLAHAWYGTGHRGREGRFGVGIRQAETGGGAFSPWFNAPPGTDQRLAMFLLPAATPDAAIAEALRFTRSDRYADLPGYKTFASHFHMAVAMAALERKAKGQPDTIPDFVRMFKAMNVDILHLAEFHGDGHPQDPGETRLRELAAMFAECRRLSDEELLVLPGEEANVHFGVSRPGQHPGHWVYLFPKEVAWIMKRSPGEAFATTGPDGHLVYRVGDAAEMRRLLEIERGLAWTSHPRIKASAWAPDAYKDEPYFRSDRWLGAAWKAMPADLSHGKLGVRVLDLLDDMADWGARKQVLGEADVFKLDHTHELFGHMNVNYVKLDRLPRYPEGWGSLLDSLRAGRFFVTTGEVLIPRFTVGGLESGGVLTLPADGGVEILAEVEGTFPLAFADIVTGGGEEGRFRVTLGLEGDDPPAFAKLSLKLSPDLTGQTWVRLEVWDVAGNGAFTQPVWLVPAR